MRRFQKIFLVFCVWSFFGCTDFSKTPVNFLSLEDHFSHLSEKNSYREEVSSLKTSLENILESSTSNDFFSKSLDDIKKEAQKLGFDTRTSGSTLIISLGKNLSKKTRIFFFELVPTKEKPIVGVKFSEIPVDNSMVSGYQSLYPKGVLISLLYAWKELKMVSASAQSIQIIVTKDEDSIHSVLSELRTEWDKEAILIFPVKRSYAFSQRAGELDFDIRVPQDKKLFKDITTEGENILLQLSDHIMSASSGKDETLHFSLSPKKGETSDPLGIQDFTPLLESIHQYLDKEPDFQQEHGRTILALMNFLPSSKNLHPSPPFSSLYLSSLSTSQGNIDFSFHAFLDPKFIPKDGIQVFLKDFAKTSIFSTLEKPGEGYQILLSHSIAPYSTSTDSRVYKLYKETQASFSKVYSLSNLLEEEPGDLPLDITKNFPLFFMGFFFGSSNFYSYVGYVPDMKLFLDKEYFFHFLSQDLP